EVADETWQKAYVAVWNLSRTQILETEKPARAIYLRLGELYERLATATDAEWEAYAKMVSDARISGLRKNWPEFAKRMNEVTRKTRKLLGTRSARADANLDLGTDRRDAKTPESPRSQEAHGPARPRPGRQKKRKTLNSKKISQR